MNRQTQRGFSLVELSIVLVIIGLLVGGVMAGRHLIRSAELQSAPTTAEKFKSAITAFKDAYDYQFPGDMVNATNYWTGAVNGNGNGRIDYNGGLLGEEHRVWQHLSMARLIEGSYPGTAVDQIPKGQITNSFYRVSYQTNVYGKSGHMISLNGLNGTVANAPVLSPNELRTLDAKLDDGLADSGWVLGFNEQGQTGCVTNPYSSPTGSYLTGNDIRCKAFFVMD